MIQNYKDAWKVGSAMIEKELISDKDIKALADVLTNKIMEHESPEDAAGYIVEKIAQKVKAWNDRYLAGYKVEHSSMMADRYSILLNCIGKGLGKMTFEVDLKIKEYILSQSPEPQQKEIEAPQQPDNGSSGELAANGKENAPEVENNNFIPFWCDNDKDENQVPSDIKKVFNTKNNHDKFIKYCYSVQNSCKPYELIAKKFAEIRFKGIEEKTDKQHTGATLLFNYLSLNDKDGKERPAPHLDLLKCSFRTWSRFFSAKVKD